MCSGGNRSTSGVGLKTLPSIREQLRQGSTTPLPGGHSYFFPRSSHASGARRRRATAVIGYRIRQVDDFNEYLKVTTDVFQQIRTPAASPGGTVGTS
jgi:hypothetical protein